MAAWLTVTHSDGWQSVHPALRSIVTTLNDHATL